MQSDYPSIDPATSRTYPLPPMQQGMLLYSSGGLSSNPYVQQLVCTLSQEFDVACFRAAWQHLVDRHAVLRTVFHLEGRDEPVQEVCSKITWDLEQSDWRDGEPAENGHRPEWFLLEDRRRAFVLDSNPPWRLHLLCCPDGGYRLVWTSHHALFDGRSRRVLLRELSALYGGLRRGALPTLEPPPPYEDHVRWLVSQDFGSARTFWVDALCGYQGTTRLPHDPVESLPDEDQESHLTLEFHLPAEQRRALRDMAATFGVTLNTIVQGAWALLLSLYSGTEDTVFGATRACRQSSVESAGSMVGLFINTLPVRVCVRASAPMSNWLREIRSQWLGMRKYEHTPLAMLQRWSELPPGIPLFESIVVFENDRLGDFLNEREPDWPASDYRLVGTTNYPIVVAGFGGRSLSLELTFDRRRFSDEMAERIKDHLRTVLASMADNPGATLGELTILAPSEQLQLVSEWNRAEGEIHRDASISQLFEKQAARAPAAIALNFDGGHWTYSELNGRANRLAHRLRAISVGPGTPVAICVDRSPEMVVGILGILKAGGAYVPLDPAYPVERLRFILRDTKAPAILGSNGLSSNLTAEAAHFIDINADLAAGDHSLFGNPPPTATADSLAYIMYTSGSTGVPKGVAIPHRGIVRLVFGLDCVQLGSSRTILHLSSPSFDASTFELWGSLLRGGRCVLYPGRVPTLTMLERFLRESAVDTLFLTTALFHSIIDESPEILVGIRQLVVGGDVLSADHVRRALARLPRTEIINGYGPTETTTFATTYRVPRDFPTDSRSVPIGTPIGNTTVCLLDAMGRLVPAGVAGELYIGGPGVALGYWERPEATAERFVPDPFNPAFGGRWYRTGDLGRRRLDGNIEFLGRLDAQVKVRGFRIEPGEIEASLRRHDAVRDALVVPFGEPARTGMQLVAYVVTRTESAPPAGELRNFLRGTLPDYMVPSAFVVLDQMPLSPNGKVDRCQLPPPDASRQDGNCDVDSGSPLEVKLAGMFADLLGRGPVGVHDDFFELGGHSLLAMQAVSHIRQALDIELPLTSVFARPTAAGLAETVLGLLRSGADGHDLPMVRSPRPGTFPLLLSQRSVWDLHERYPGKPFPNPSRAYRLRGPLSLGALHDSVAALIERHEALRSNFARINGSPAQIINSPAPPELRCLDLSRLPEESQMAEAQRIFDVQTRYCFDPKNDLLFHSRLVRLDNDDHILAFTFSHMIADAWSLSVFLRELSVLYQAFSTGTRSDLPELPVQPADVACWEGEYQESAAAARQVAYQRDNLAGAALSASFPCDGSEPEPGDLRSVRPTLVVPERLVTALRELGRREGCTLSMTLLAALKALICEVTGEEDILVGLPLAARSRPEVDGLIGCFRKRVILRTDLSGRPTVRQLLQRVREGALRAYLNADVSLESAFPDRSASHPLHWTQVPTSFNYVEGMLRPFALHGLSISTIERNYHYSFSRSDIMALEFNSGLRLLHRATQGLYSFARAQLILEEYVALLERVVADSDRRISRALVSRLRDEAGP
jgi:amino acid adenylation domain-containing protein